MTSLPRHGKVCEERNAGRALPAGLEHGGISADQGRAGDVLVELLGTGTIPSTGIPICQAGAARGRSRLRRHLDATTVEEYRRPQQHGLHALLLLRHHAIPGIVHKSSL